MKAQDNGRGTTPVWKLQRGQRFKVPGVSHILTFFKMDGRYCQATTEEGELVYYSGNAEVL